MSNQEIDQLYYTSAQTGLGRSPGFRVRAASPGLQDLRSARFAELQKYLNYFQPDGANAVSLQSDDAPISFAFVRNKMELLLLRRIYLGRNYEGRPGNYSVHLLVGLSPDFTAREAISLWESAFWRRIDALLPDEVELPFVSEQDLKTQAGFDGIRPPQEKKDQEALRFVIQAFLSLSFAPNQRLYIAAPAEKTAAFIWGLAQALPRGLLKQLTFSTYERDVQQASTLIVGTCWTSSKIASGMDLPASCYSGNGFALNYYSNKSSAFETLKSTGRAADYAHFAVDSLNRNPRALRDFCLAAEKDGISEVNALLLSYYVYQMIMVDPSKLTNQDYDGLISTPALAARLFQEPLVEQHIIDRARQDRQWWQQRGLKLFDGLSGYSDPEIQKALKAFAVRAAVAAKEALQPAQIVRPMRAVDEALWIMNNLAKPAVARQDPGIPSRKLFELCSTDSSFKVPADLTWREREQLLAEWDQCLASDTTPSQWLNIPPREVAQFLGMRLNHSQWKKVAIRNAIVDSSSGGEVRDHILSWIQGNKAGILAAVREIASDGQQMPMLKNVFAGIGRRDVGFRRELLQEVVRAAGTTASANSIVRAVTDNLNPNALDPQDWEDLLDVPVLAARMLRETAFQDGVISCAMRDRSWGEHAGRGSIEKLSEAAKTNPDLHESLGVFAENMAKKSKGLSRSGQTGQTIWDAETAIWLLDNLAVPAAFRQDPAFPYWLLYDECFRDNTFRVPSELSWINRQRLLTEWGKKLVQSECPDKWLSMPVGQLDQCIRMTSLRSEWKQRALYYAMIDPNLTQDVQRSIPSWINSDEALVLNIVRSIASDEQRRVLTVVFGGLRPGSEKIKLFEDLIESIGNEPGFDGIVSVARLNSPEFGMLLSGKKRDWVMGCLTAKQVEGETIRKLMRDYLRTLDLARAREEFNAQLLEELWRNRAKFAPDLNSLVKSWDAIVGFIQNDNLTQGVERLSASWLGLDKGLRDRCSPALVESIASRLCSPGELERVLQGLGSLLCASESELFGRMFVFAGKQSGRDIGRLGPYFYLAYTANPTWKVSQVKFREILQKQIGQVEGRARIPSLEGALKAYHAIYTYAYDEKAFRQDLAKFNIPSPSAGATSLVELVDEGVRAVDKFFTGLFGGGNAQPQPKVATEPKVLKPPEGKAGTKKAAPGPSSAGAASNQGSATAGKPSPTSDKTGGAVAPESKPERTRPGGV